MGSLMNSIFGGENSQGQSTSSSSNQAFPYLQGALGGTIGQGTNAGTSIGNLLGLNGAPAQNQGFSNWKDSTGYQFGLDQGMKSITGGAATSGLLNSGSTLKALNTYGQNYADTKFQDYLNPLQGLLGSGLTGAGILGSAGNVSNSQSTQSASKSNGGPGGFIGSLLAK